MSSSFRIVLRAIPFEILRGMEWEKKTTYAGGSAKKKIMKDWGQKKNL